MMGVFECATFSVSEKREESEESKKRKKRGKNEQLANALTSFSPKDARDEKCARMLTRLLINGGQDYAGNFFFFLRGLVSGVF